jgi:hypothetical protein
MTDMIKEEFEKIEKYRAERRSALECGERAGVLNFKEAGELHNMRRKDVGL